MGRAENAAIFEHTQKLFRTDPELMAAIKHSNTAQEVIPEVDNVVLVEPRFAVPAQITVSRKRSFEAAEGYLPGPVCVLNFASATNPGGGVTRGSTAQEECLCRCSTLYANLTDPKVWKPFYAAHRQLHDQRYNDDIIYTPDVVVFKSDEQEPKMLDRKDWWKVNVITCAAPNLRPNRDGETFVKTSKRELFNLHIKRARRILAVAAQKGNDVVILGAYGCGAFMNPPDIVAAAMSQVALEYRYHFKTIEFAVYCSPHDDTNYQIFKQVIGRNSDP